MRFCVAIDGPSGAGKSTLSRRAAEQLGFLYVDTGAIYRAVALSYLERGALELDKTNIEILHRDGLQHVLLNGRDVTADIRRHEVSGLASDLSARPEVREYLLNMQREMAASGKVIMDGRDIGTVVVPDAELKIFLTADPEDRARRRYKELIAKGQEVCYDDVLRDVRQRDRNDMTRPIAPLRKADDAIELDTTGNTFDRSLGLLTDLIRKGLERCSTGSPTD